MNTVIEINEKRSGLIAEAQQLYNSANGSLSDEQNAKFDSLMAEADKLEARAKQLSRLEKHQSFLNQSAGRQSDPVGPDLPKETRKHRYSLLRAIGKVWEGKELDGLEGEISRELENRNGKKPSGFFMPMHLENRAFDLTAATGLISSDYLDSQNFIELLRNKLVVAQAGAKYITGIGGTFALPRQSAAATAYWVSAGSNVTGSAQTTDQVQFTAKTLGALTDIYRKTILQSSLDADALVRDDLAKVLAIELDRAALNGSGSSNQPTGILQNGSVGVVALGTNGGAPTWTMAVDMEKTVEVANADVGNLAYITNPPAKATMKTTAKIGSTYPTFIMDSDNQLNGHPVYVTNNMPSNLTKGTGTNLSSMIYGNFADLVIAQWGDGVDILVDPYTGSAAGTLRIVAMIDVDLNVRHPGSYSIVTDMITT